MCRTNKFFKHKLNWSPEYNPEYFADCPGSPSNQPKHMQSGSPGDATAAGGPHTGKKILINVSGKKFQIYRDYLER